MNEDMLRIGDAERDQAAAELGEHYAAGRLDADEHAERLEQIWQARTRGDLRPVFRDLPGRYGPAGPPPASAGRGSSYRPRGLAPLRRGLPTPVLVVLAVLVAITVATHLPVILVGLLVWCFLATRRNAGPWTHGWSARRR